MTRSLVSIVIPVFNGGQFLRQTIDSALAQTYQPTEIIVVDDGSTDESPLILKGYESHIMVVTQANAGVAAARNTGVSRSHGEWVAFLDQDDLWDARKLQVQLSHADENDDLIHCNRGEIDSCGRIVRPYRMKPNHDKTSRLADIILGHNISVCTAVVRRRALNAVGAFDPANRFGTDDWQLWLTLAATGHRFHYIDEVLSSYRRHLHNASLNVDSMVSGALYALKRTQEKFPQAFGYDVMRACKARMKFTFFDAGYTLVTREAYASAARYFWRSVGYNFLSRSTPKALVYGILAGMPIGRKLLPALRTLRTLLKASIKA